jgi:sterol desaturase/sphingolipid hydroxylase (fatty acid hydroxylase superfamily)
MQATPPGFDNSGANNKQQRRGAFMPTPLEILLDPVSLAVLAIYGGMILLEALFPARKLPRIPGWHARALGVFAVYFFLSSFLPLLWGDLLAPYRLVNLETVHPLVGTAIGVLVFELLVYVWHRAATMFLATFQHTNIRTPQWLGRLVQRPESHSVHHGRGIHHYNYSDLPLFDLIFGTFRNPKELVTESGFEGVSSAQILDMLVGRDVAAGDFEQSVRPTRPRVSHT